MSSWHDPIIPVAVEELKTKGRWDPSVQAFRRSVDWTLSASDWDRVREGYGCLSCLQPQETPFPEACSLCGYAMRTKQRQDMEWDFEGEKHIGPSTTIQYELDRLDDWGERHNWRKEGSIFVPGWACAP